jgi:hypothetical protein
MQLVVNTLAFKIANNVKSANSKLASHNPITINTSFLKQQAVTLWASLPKHQYYPVSQRFYLPIDGYCKLSVLNLG